MEVTRQQITETALSMRGVKFLHQGRSRNGVDCMGFLAVVMSELGYTDIIDVEGYKVSPPASLIYETLCKNFDEIPVSEVGLGDIFLMRLGGRKAKHASILVKDTTDIENGIEPMIAHAYGMGGKGCVVLDTLNSWKPRCVKGFRFRGLTDV